MAKKKNIIKRIHESMNEFFATTKTQPRFLYLGQSEVEAMDMCEGLFCPSEFSGQIHEDDVFGMDPVYVERESFLRVG